MSARSSIKIKRLQSSMIVRAQSYSDFFMKTNATLNLNYNEKEGLNSTSRREWFQLESPFTTLLPSKSLSQGLLL